MNNLLEIASVSKSYKNRSILSDVSFSLRGGVVTGLLGPNGAGKTTLISIILGLVAPSSGSVYVEGEKSLKRDVLRKMNYAASYAELPGNVTCYENLLIFSYLYGLNRPKEKAEEALANVGLTSHRNKKAGLLSTGERMRLIIAKSLLNEPKILLLDEPTAALDPEASKFITDKIVEYAKNSGASVLWTSHDMFEMENVCDNVLFLFNGSVKLEGSPTELIRAHEAKNLEDLFLLLYRQYSTKKVP